MLKTEIA